MALTDTAIRNARPKEKPYKVADSQGLYLLVNPRGSKLWRVKYRINGVERKLALGSYPEITLAEARTARDAARRQLAHAVDPNAAKRQARIEASVRASNSFAAVAEELIEKKGREGLAQATLEKQRWLLKLLGADFAPGFCRDLTLDALHLHRLADERDITIRRQERYVSGIAPDADARHFGRARHARRIDEVPVAVEIHFRDGMEILRPGAERIGTRHARGDMRGARECDHHMRIVAADAAAFDKAVERARLGIA